MQRGAYRCRFCGQLKKGHTCKALRLAKYARFPAEVSSDEESEVFSKRPKTCAPGAASSNSSCPAVAAPVAAPVAPSVAPSVAPPPPVAPPPSVACHQASTSKAATVATSKSSANAETLDPQVQELVAESCDQLINTFKLSSETADTMKMAWKSWMEHTMLVVAQHRRADVLKAENDTLSAANKKLSAANTELSAANEELRAKLASHAKAASSASSIVSRPGTCDALLLLMHECQQQLQRAEAAWKSMHEKMHEETVKTFEQHNTSHSDKTIRQIQVRKIQGRLNAAPVYKYVLADAVRARAGQGPNNFLNDEYEIDDSNVLRELERLREGQVKEVTYTVGLQHYRTVDMTHMPPSCESVRRFEDAPIMLAKHLLYRESHIVLDDAIIDKLMDGLDANDYEAVASDAFTEFGMWWSRYSGQHKYSSESKLWVDGARLLQWLRIAKNRGYKDIRIVMHGSKTDYAKLRKEPHGTDPAHWALQVRMNPGLYVSVGDMICRAYGPCSTEQTGSGMLGLLLCDKTSDANEKAPRFDEYAPYTRYKFRPSKGSVGVSRQLDESKLTLQGKAVLNATHRDDTCKEAIVVYECSRFLPLGHLVEDRRTR